MADSKKFSACHNAAVIDKKGVDHCSVCDRECELANPKDAVAAHEAEGRTPPTSAPSKKGAKAPAPAKKDEDKDDDEDSDEEDEDESDDEDEDEEEDGDDEDSDTGSTDAASKPAAKGGKGKK